MDPKDTGTNSTFTYVGDDGGHVPNLTDFVWDENWGDVIRDFQRQKLYTYQNPFTIVLIVLYSVAFLTGFIGNILVITVVIRHRSMRTLTNMFLVNLAIGDFLVIMICMPLTLGRYVYRNWVYGESMCKLTPFVQGVSVAVSVLTLLAISLDRFLAILKPMKARIIFSTRTVKFIICAIWLVSTVLFVPVLFVNKTMTETLLNGLFQVVLCKEHWQEVTSKQIYNLFIFLALFMCPLLIMTVAYIKTGSILWRGDKQITRNDSLVNANSLAQNKILRGRQRVVKMLISIVIMFALSWLPYHVINIWTEMTIVSDDSEPTDPTARLVANYGYPLAQWFGLANSATNPLCYCFMSKSFRGAFISVCKCRTDVLVDSQGSRRVASKHARTWKNTCSLYAENPEGRSSFFYRIMESIKRNKKSSNSDTHSEEMDIDDKKEFLDKVTAI